MQAKSTSTLKFQNVFQDRPLRYESQTRITQLKSPPARKSVCVCVCKNPKGVTSRPEYRTTEVALGLYDRPTDCALYSRECDFMRSVLVLKFTRLHNVIAVNMELPSWSWCTHVIDHVYRRRGEYGSRVLRGKSMFDCGRLT